MIRNAALPAVSRLVLSGRRAVSRAIRGRVEYPHFRVPTLVQHAATRSMSDKEDLRKRLTPLQYHVTQEKGTERPFSGCYNKFYEPGTYVCVVCSQPLFSSDTKYDSGCGWPAFNEVLDKGRVKLSPDTSGVGANLLLLISQPGRIRTEVTCSECGAHLGHVFNDGPPPTKKRFCINSASMTFIPAPADAEKTSGDS